MIPKPVTIQLAIFNGDNQPRRMVDWEAVPTQISGLYLTRPNVGYWKDQVLAPAKTGWNVTHKSGWAITPQNISSLSKAKKFLEALAQQNLNWDRPMDELQTEYKVYISAVRKAWELTQ